jgi:CRP-like cAMP-binding protein
MKEQIYIEGDALMKEGDIASCLTIIVEGEAVELNYDSTELIRTYIEGEHFGEDALITWEPI